MTSHIEWSKKKKKKKKQKTRNKKQEVREPAATNYGQHDSIAFPQQRTRTGPASNQLGTSLVT